ncbi:hypothetical protein DL96DRAFT_1758963 [Flagelloscypha sp. PMI_526]|nr:hypothetical protein DL96DRAFT_1758963 [Flagelloscypha sp. PMI_526]
MNGLEVPVAPDGTFHALTNVTHISVVPNGANSFGLPIFRRFVSLTHLAVVNPGVGYTHAQLLSFETGLPHLHILVINLLDYDPSVWHFDETGKIVTMREPDGEFSFKTADRRSSLWTIAEILLFRRQKERDVSKGADPSSSALAAKLANVYNITLFFPSSQGAEEIRISCIGQYSERKTIPVVMVYETQTSTKIQGTDGGMSNMQL